MTIPIVVALDGENTVEGLHGEQRSLRQRLKVLGLAEMEKPPLHGGFVGLAA